jgi:hypothetical protein
MATSRDIGPRVEEPIASSPEPVPAIASRGRSPLTVGKEPVVARDDSPRTRTVVHRLSQAAALKYAGNVTLERVVADVARATRRPDGSTIPILVDPVGLSMMEKTMESPLTGGVEGIPLRTSLHLLLAELGLVYGVHDGLLVISGSEELDRACKVPLAVTRDDSPATRTLRARLEQPLDLKLAGELPLARVLWQVKNATRGPDDPGISICVDRQGLDAADRSMNSLVESRALAGVPLRTTLRILLDQLDLAWYIADGRLMIGDAESIEAQLKETAGSR